MIRTLIIDDENRARKLLQNMLEKLPPNAIQVIGTADDVQSGLDAINKHKPDLVFLDVQMTEGTGFDLLDKVKEVDFEVIFVTAYDEYAIRAFQFSAFGYLLKPIKPTELNIIVQKVEEHWKKLKEKANERVRILIENYQNREEIKKLIINHMSGFNVSLVEDIIRLEGDNNYTHFILADGSKVTTSSTLKEYEDLLHEHGFFRIHQSTIVNLRHIVNYYKGVGGKVELTDGKVCNVSRYRKAGFLAKFS